jgi:hypothetical protein
VKCPHCHRDSDEKSCATCKHFVYMDSCGASRKPECIKCRAYSNWEEK